MLKVKKFTMRQLKTKDSTWLVFKYVDGPFLHFNHCIALLLPLQDDDSDWPTESETSSSDEDEKYTGQLTAEFFLKKKGDDAEELERKRKEKEKERERRRERDRQRKAEEAAEDAADGWTKVTTGIPGQAQPKAKLFPDDAEITIELVTKKLIEILAGRGKKGTDRSEQVRWQLMHTEV